MKRSLFYVLLTLIFGSVLAYAGTSWQLELTPSSEASFEQIATPNQVSFLENAVQITSAGGAVRIRTGEDCKLVDDGRKPMEYSYSEHMSSGGSMGTEFWIRLDSSGMRNGYVIFHFYDGQVAFLKVNRCNNGVNTTVYDSSEDPERSTGEDFRTFEASSSIKVTNSSASVDLEIHFGNATIKVSDKDAEQIRDGLGVGLGFINNGTPGDLSCEFSNIKTNTF